MKKLGQLFKRIGRWLTAPDHLQQGIMEMTGELSARVIRAGGQVEHLGVIARKKVTTAFVNLLVDALQASGSLIETFKYHDSGTGTTAESNADTALETPTGVSRVTGTQVEGASANIYKSVGTITYDGSYAVTEHGLFSAATSGTLMDRSVFSAINVAINDQIEFTYELTANAET
jgi:hypothetical protein